MGKTMRSTFRVMFVIGLLFMLISFSAALDINDSRSLDYYHDGDHRFGVDTDGTITAYGDLVFDDAQDLSIENLHELDGFFTGDCDPGEAVQEVDDDGDYQCVDITEEAAGANLQNLSEVLTQGNVANQSIDMDGEDIDDVGDITSEGDLSITGGNVGIGGEASSDHPLFVRTEEDSPSGIYVQNEETGGTAQSRFSALAGDSTGDGGPDSQLTFSAYPRDFTLDAFQGRTAMFSESAGDGINIAALNESGDIRFMTGGDGLQDEMMRIDPEEIAVNASIDMDGEHIQNVGVLSVDTELADGNITDVDELSYGDRFAADQIPWGSVDETLDLSGNDLVDDAGEDTTIWDSTADHIPIGVLEEDAITIQTGESMEIDGSESDTITLGDDSGNLDVVWDDANDLDGSGNVDGLSEVDTDDLSEGDSNLYFEDSRVRDVLEVSDGAYLTWDDDEDEFDVDAGSMDWGSLDIDESHVDADDVGVGDGIQEIDGDIVLDADDLSDTGSLSDNVVDDGVLDNEDSFTMTGLTVTGDGMAATFEDSVRVEGDLDVWGNVSSTEVEHLEVDGSILPPEGYDGDFDIGGDGSEWQDAYFTGDITVGGLVDDVDLSDQGEGLSLDDNDRLEVNIDEDTLEIDGDGNVAVDEIDSDQLDETDSYNLDWSNLDIDESHVDADDVGVGDGLIDADGDMALTDACNNDEALVWDEGSSEWSCEDASDWGEGDEDQNLESVLSEGTSAGDHDIDMDGQDIDNINALTADGTELDIDDDISVAGDVDADDNVDAGGDVSADGDLSTDSGNVGSPDTTIMCIGDLCT